MRDEIDTSIHEIDRGAPAVKDEPLHGYVDADKRCLSGPPHRQQFSRAGPETTAQLRNEQPVEEVSHAISRYTCVSQDRGYVFHPLNAEELECLEPEVAKSLDEGSAKCRLVSLLGRESEVRPERPAFILLDRLRHQVGRQHCRVPGNEQ